MEVGNANIMPKVGNLDGKSVEKSTKGNLMGVTLTFPMGIRHAHLRLCRKGAGLMTNAVGLPPADCIQRGFG